MSDSSEPETSLQESQPAEPESNSQQGDIANSIKKRTLDADDDEDPQNASSKLENLKKLAKKPTARRIQFERTEEEALDGEGDALPISCSICREPFLDPVVTRCKHYFCKQCALKHHEKNINCFVCDKATLGVFNTAVEIKKKIAQVREKAQAMVKEVSTTVEKAAVLVKNAEAMSAESARIVEEVETMVGIVAAGPALVAAYGPEAAADADPSSWDSVIRLVGNVEVVAANARGMAEKAADMMQEANAKTETARAEMAKALVVMKNVKWNV